MLVLPYTFRTLALKIFICLGLVATADIFFYGHAAGWTAGIFALLLLAAVTLLSQENKGWPQIALQCLCALLAGSALSMQAGILSTIVFAASLLALLVAGKRQRLTSAWIVMQDMACFFGAAGQQWSHDLSIVKKLRRLRKSPPINALTTLMVVALPAVLAALFLILFSYANPLIAQALAKLDITTLRPYLSPVRWFIWTCIGMFVWALLRPRYRLPAKPLLGTLPTLGGWVSRSSIIWSLALFNTLFALQNGLDVAFLWQHENLPAGISYAEYAHDGAYPLIVTALLAAAYVLLTYSDKRYQSAAARGLVLLWVLQNIFLVVSAIDRTLNYIDIYALTYLRLSALVWMGLVGIGLALIVVRVLGNRSNLWLLDCNLLALAATLYICCFINFDSYIARYNVVHSDVSGNGQRLDIGYLEKLGPDAIAPLHWYAENTKDELQIAHAYEAVNRLEISLEREVDHDWRAWTWHKARLQQDLQPWKPE
ncbi:MAG: DUF4173 domain-containing protein [Micavibrio sp.]|nr:DUF4173 domain-containing protein [Micavibrio sp.]